MKNSTPLQFLSFPWRRKMINRLPREIITDILSRLQLHHLLRYRYVCKTWYAIVSDPLFFTLHFNLFSPTNTTDVFVIHCNCDTDWEKPLCLVEDGNEMSIHPITAFARLRFPLTLSFSSSLISQSLLVGSCNGLLCLSSIDIRPESNIPRNPIYILNPITGEYQQLPELVSLNSCTKVFSGFGFDVSTQKFKVVLLLFHMASGGSLRNEMLIHTLGSDAWRRRIGNPPSVLFQAFQVNSPAFVQGSLHWVTMDTLSLRPLIVAFEVDLEVFRIVLTPPEAPRVLTTQLEFPVESYRLLVLEGCLSLVDSSSEHLIEIWSMKKYDVTESWVKMFSLQKESMWLACYQSFLPVKIRNNSELLLLCDDNLLISYNTENNKGREIKCLKNETLWNPSVQVFPLVASIISPKVASKLDSCSGRQVQVGLY